MPPNPFVVLNAGSARFECTYGRGCDGVCCREGRPPVSADDARQIDRALPDALPLMRREARRVLEHRGYVSRGSLRVVRGWCIFFHDGCILHQIGESRGGKFAHKPLACALFPLTRRSDGRWYVRQKGTHSPKETWDLFCLAPTAGTPLAVENLKDELALAARIG